MYTETLVGSEIADGQQLIEALRAAGLEPKAAFWYFATERKEWRMAVQFRLRHDRSLEMGERVERVRRSIGGSFRRVLTRSRTS